MKKKKKFATLIIMLEIALSGAFSAYASSPESLMADNLYGRACARHTTALDSLRELADNTTNGRAQQLYALYLQQHNKHKEALAYYKRGAENGQYICAARYFCLLADKKLSMYDSVRAARYRDEWIRDITAKSQAGDAAAMHALGRAYYGEDGSAFYYMVENRTDQMIREGRELIRQAANKGDAFAQYNYAMNVINSNEEVAESRSWLEKSAKNGYEDACLDLSYLLLCDGKYDGAIALATSVIQKLPQSVFRTGNTRHMSAREIRTLAQYLKSNPGFSLTGFGPDKTTDDTFVCTRDSIIMACATYKGKAGVLKLNLEGQRVNHDDFPFVYKEITPVMDEFLPFEESNIFFHPRPYSYKIPLTDYEIRVVDYKGNETTYSIYSSNVEMVSIPDNYIYDGVGVNELNSTDTDKVDSDTAVQK